MIKHVVCWQMKDVFTPEEKVEKLRVMKEALLSLKDKISFIRSIEVGINDPQIDPSNYDICLIVLLDSAEDLARYQHHPEHVAVRELVKSLTSSRACVDFQV